MFLQIVISLISIAGVGSSSDVLKHVYFNRVHVIANPEYCPKYIAKLEFITRDLKSNTLGSALADLVRKYAEQYSNMIHGCPYEGDLSVNKMPLTGALFQYIFVPAGDYKLVLNTTLNERKTAGLLTTVYISVAAGRTLEDDRMG
ncbi:hypothetical protein Bhyg_09443 [Pseudolycoriella hygida]|uniref:MD-2-related lipid-recognition domain-containing protein n=1 Tax=Pseudolycoriella hygida TaxID=35572 RepID=A0A9Q0S4E7_9DIPT|nr:hypothetical protein Bhyg_09443 [Pseudolycoriella hygida]